MISKSNNYGNTLYHYITWFDVRCDIDEHILTDMKNVCYHNEFVPIDCLVLFEVYAMRNMNDQVEIKFVLPTLCSTIWE